MSKAEMKRCDEFLFHLRNGYFGNFGHQDHYDASKWLIAEGASDGALVAESEYSCVVLLSTSAKRFFGSE